MSDRYACPVCECRPLRTAGSFVTHMDGEHPAHDHDHDPVHDGCRRCGALPLDGVPCEPPEPMTTTPKETDRG